MPARGWLAIAYAHPGRDAASDDRRHRRRGRRRVSARRRSPSASRPSTVTGGLYYWTATSTGGTTYRLPFGASQASPFIVPSSPTNPLVCGGCHSVSRDGRMISFTATADLGSQVAFLADGADHRARRPQHRRRHRHGRARRPERRRVSPRSTPTAAACWCRPSVTSRCTTPRQARWSTSATPTRCCRRASWSRIPSGRPTAGASRSPCIRASLHGAPRITDSRPEDGEIVTLELDPTTGQATGLRRIVADQPPTACSISIRAGRPTGTGW